MSAPVPPRGLGASIAGYDGAEPGVRLVDRADEPAEPVPWFRRWLWPAIIAIGTALGMIAAGIDIWRAALVAIGCAVAWWSVIASASVPRVSWHGDIPGRTFHAPSTWEVPGLTGARESVDSFTEYLRPRLWTIASDLLRRRGIDPGSDQARETVGRRQYALLVGEERDPRRMTSSVSALCQTVARLAASEPGSSPALRRLAGARPSSPDRRLAAPPLPITSAHRKDHDA